MGQKIEFVVPSGNHPNLKDRTKERRIFLQHMAGCGAGTVIAPEVASWVADRFIGEKNKKELHVSTQDGQAVYKQDGPNLVAVTQPEIKTTGDIIESWFGRFAFGASLSATFDLRRMGKLDEAMFDEAFKLSLEQFLESSQELDLEVEMLDLCSSISTGKFIKFFSNSYKDFETNPELLERMQETAAQVLVNLAERGELSLVQRMLTEKHNLFAIDRTKVHNALCAAKMSKQVLRAIDRDEDFVTHTEHYGRVDIEEHREIDDSLMEVTISYSEGNPADEPIKRTIYIDNQNLNKTFSALKSRRIAFDHAEVAAV